LVVVVSPFAGFLFWFGISAIYAGHLEPLSGPEFGQYFFGSLTLEGRPARIAGLSLVTLGSSFLAIAYRFSRVAGEGQFPCFLPWVLLTISQFLALVVKASR
jgi:hypothetical protein